MRRQRSRAVSAGKSWQCWQTTPGEKKKACASSHCALGRCSQLMLSLHYAQAPTTDTVYAAAGLGCSIPATTTAAGKPRCQSSCFLVFGLSFLASQLNKHLSSSLKASVIVVSASTPLLGSASTCLQSCLDNTEAEQVLLCLKPAVQMQPRQIQSARLQKSEGVSDGLSADLHPTRQPSYPGPGGGSSLLGGLLCGCLL